MTTRNENCQERTNQICDYIYEHLNDDLSVDQLSTVACFSRYHFHRQFTDYMGIGVFKFIQLLRLKRASYQLFFQRDTRIIDIALDAKFEYPESFARAFKKEFGQSPSEFRHRPNWLSWSQKYNHRDKVLEEKMNIEIVNFVETKIAVYEHRAAPQLINESTNKFI